MPTSRPAARGTIKALPFHYRNQVEKKKEIRGWMIPVRSVATIAMVHTVQSRRELLYFVVVERHVAGLSSYANSTSVRYHITMLSNAR